MRSKRPSGYTLIELMITLAVVAALLTMAWPSFQESLRGNRVATSNNEVLASLSLARTEAIKGLGPAGVCPSSSGTACTSTTDWAAGWIVWRDERTATGTNRVVVRYIQPRAQTTMTGPAGGIQFTTQGRAQSGAAQVSVAPYGVSSPARCIRVSSAGQTRTSQAACS